MAADGVSLRRNIGELSLHRRSGGLNARERVMEGRLAGLATAFFVLADMEREGEGSENSEADEMDEDATTFLLFRQDMLTARLIERPPYVFHRKTFADYGEAECYNRMRFRREDLPRLQHVLGIPDVLHGKNRALYLGEEALVFLLLRMAYPDRLSDFEEEFGRDYTSLSRLFRVITKFLYDRHSHVLKDGLAAWTDHFPEFARVIARVTTVDGDDHVVAFVDGTLRPTTRLSQVEGAVDDAQRGAYNGHHRTHGIKFQGVMAPNGIMIALHGPFAGNRHDAYLMDRTGLNALMATAQLVPAPPRKHVVYGDAAYGIMPYVQRGFRGVNLTEAQRRYNRKMSAARICVEWGFGETMTNFALLDYKKNLKIFLSPIGQWCTVAQLLQNCHTCLYGSNATRYFNLAAPSLEDYFDMFT
ncbi:unnamed protein product [Phaeothamnion confervicola]